MSRGTDIIAFGCPKCGAVCSAGTVLAGKLGRCKACGEVVTVPESQREPVQPAPVAEPQAIQHAIATQQSPTVHIPVPTAPERFWWWPTGRIAAYVLTGFLSLAAIASLLVAGPVGSVINVFVWYVIIASVRFFHVRVIQPARTRGRERLQAATGCPDSSETQSSDSNAFREEQ